MSEQLGVAVADTDTAKLAVLASAVAGATVSVFAPVAVNVTEQLAVVQVLIAVPFIFHTYALVLVQVAL